MGPPRRVVATLIPLEHGSRLKRILFALPPVSLRGHRVAVTDRGILVDRLARTSTSSRSASCCAS